MDTGATGLCFKRTTLYLLYFSLLSVTSNFCPDQEHQRMKCCSGYFLYEENGNQTCLKCVGAVGVNCSTHCEVGFYGEGCKFQCQCPKEQCDRIEGCLEDPKEDEEKNIPARAPDIDDFIKNISNLQWLIFAIVLVPLVILCCSLIYVNRRNKDRNQIRRRTRSSTNRAYISHCLPREPASEVSNVVFDKTQKTFAPSREYYNILKGKKMLKSKTIVAQCQIMM